MKEIKFQNFLGLSNPISKLIYEKVNKKVEKHTGILHFALLKVTVLATMMPSFILSYLVYFTTNSGSDAFQLAFPMWFPFNWQTPVGYLIAFGNEFIAFSCICFGSDCFMGLLISATEMLMSISIDLKEELNTLNERFKVNTNPMELKNAVCEFIQFHSDANQLS